MALVNAAEKEHAACVRALKNIRGPGITIWPVITEALYLVRGVVGAGESILRMLEAGDLMLAELGRSDVASMRELMRKYRDLPMDLADAGLVRVAERDHCTRILTLDRRDFALYRIGRSGRFDILP